MNLSSKLTALLVFCACHASLLGQRYNVQIQDEYVKPTYLVFQMAGEDPARVHSNFASAFERAGFELVNEIWANTQISKEEKLINVAKVLHDWGAEVSEKDLKQQLRAMGLTMGWKDALKSLVRQGLVTSRIEEDPDIKWKKEEYYGWVDGSSVPESMWSRPNAVHKLSWNYTYRGSLSCGTTLTEIHGSIREISGGRNVQLVDFDYNQPSLGSDCPKEIINSLVRSIVRDMRDAPSSFERSASSDIAFRSNDDSHELDQIQTILTVAKPGLDCMGVQASEVEDDLALGLMELYDIVDRSVLDQVIQEHKLNMDGLFKDSDFLEAGQFAGAEAIVTLQKACMGNKNILKAKMISVNSNVILWSAIAKNEGRTIDAQEVVDVILSQ